MNYLTKESIKVLLNDKNRSPAITIYMSAHRIPTPPNMSEDQIRFKNLMHQALEILKRQSASHDFIKFVNDERERVSGDKTFWEDQTEGLLICIRPNQVLTYNLPFDSEEYVAVDDHFHLAPIYAYLADQMDYYVLALAQHNPKLYRGNMHSLEPAEVTLPSNIEEALNIDEPHQRSVQFRSGAGNGGAAYHGHGSIKDAGDQDRLRFFRLIDDKISGMKDTILPLLIASTESEATEYKSISRYPRTLETFINGNYTEAHPSELYKLARPIIEEEIISSSRAEVIERFARLSGENKNMVATEHAAIKEAAEKGRVATLAVAMSRKTRDTVRDDTTQKTKLVFAEGVNNKFLDYVAKLVWSQSGKVVNLAEDQMPENSRMFAIMRY